MKHFPSFEKNGSYLLLLLLLFVSLNISKADSIVAFNDLNYHSNFEEEAFYKLENTYKPDYFALFLSADKDVGSSDYAIYKSVLGVSISKFDDENFNGLKDKKKIKKIYKSVHESMLDKYELNANFSQLFTKQEYQCVTSSMLFALVFNKLKIPYELEFQPDHVFLIAYPETSKIMVQTTNPQKGVFIYDNNFKGKYINYLRDSKLISKYEFENKSIDALFTEYFLKTEAGDLRKLASTQYYNLGLEKLLQNDIPSSLDLFMKAYYLDNSLRNKYLLTVGVGMMIDKTSATEPDYAKYLAMFTRTSSMDVKKDVFISLFYDMTQRQLYFEGNIEMYEKSYKLIKERVVDSTLLSEFAFIYNYEMGRRHINNAQYKDALPFMEEAYQIKPTNTDVQSMLVSLVSSIYTKSFYDDQKLNILNDTLDNFVETHENLRDNDKIINLMYLVKLGLMSNYFYKGNIEQAEFYQNQFENFCDANSHKMNFETKGFVEKSYSSAAAYYFKKGKYSKAREILNQGLIYAPDSYVLKARLEALN